MSSVKRQHTSTVVNDTLASLTDTSDVPKSIQENTSNWPDLSSELRSFDAILTTLEAFLNESRAILSSVENAISDVEMRSLQTRLLMTATVAVRYS